MRNILMVGGVFDESGGRPSGYFRKFSNLFDATVINGGTYQSLVDMLGSLTAVTHLFWFADVPNTFPKLLPELLNKNPGLVLIQSKNNRSLKYTKLQLFTRMRQSGAEFLVEFQDGNDGLLITSLLHASHITSLTNSPDIQQLVDDLNIQFDRIDNLIYPIDNIGYIPSDNHAGAFGVTRKNHIHEGVDLYTETHNPVYAMESGTVVCIKPFTGISAGSDWWNDTQCIMISGDSGVLNYGELTIDTLFVGDRVSKGQYLGKIETVLKIDKGLPMSMLHFERYIIGTVEPITEWSLNMDQPTTLCDPSLLLIRAQYNKMMNNE